MNEYVLKVGEAGAPRLQVLDAIIGPFSRDYLAQAGIKQDMNVVEIGCGTGMMTRWFARKVGPKGTVYALDASQEQLAKAREYIQSDAEVESNVQYICALADETTLPEKSIDIVYSRCLLMHVPQPQKVLEHLYGLLKPGGVLVCDEPTAASFFAYPAVSALEKLRDLFVELGIKRGVDFNIGDKLYGMLKRLPGEFISPRFVQPMLPHTIARTFLLMTLQESLGAALSEGVADQETLQKLMHELLQLANDGIDYCAYPRQAQIALRKSGTN